MSASPVLDAHPNIGDREMVNAQSSNNNQDSMGEGCHEDVAESAVDLDGDTAIQMDVKAESKEVAELSSSQMNFQINPNTVLPDTE